MQLCEVFMRAQESRSGTEHYVRVEGVYWYVPEVNGSDQS